MNWWLMALAFVLGLVLTGLFMVRRVTREVPVYESGAASPARLIGEKPTTAAASVFNAPEADASDARPAAGATTAAAGGVAAAKFADSGSGSEDAPYGFGSFRGATPPSGYEIKGNEDSMLYHTADSPSFEQTIAEIWFNEERTAVKAGFTRWDEGRVDAAKLVGAAEIPPGPHGPGSTAPNPDGSGPQGWGVKGNEDSMLYHSTDSPYFARTIAEVWFRDVETAEAAGFNKWDSGKSQRGTQK